MPTNYPNALDSFVDPTNIDYTNSSVVPHAGQHKNTNDAIEAIQVELGTNPSGSFDSVKDRFTEIEQDIFNLQNEVFDPDLDIPENSLSGTKIVTGSIPGSKLATGAITADKYGDGSISVSKLADDAIDRTKIAANVAGDGLIQNGDGSLSPGVDNSTIEIASDALRVKDGGITQAKLSTALQYGMPPIGSIIMWTSNTPPSGWAICDGTEVGRTDPTYSALYAVIGVVFGAGNGTTTFNLPNLVSRVPAGAGDAPTLNLGDQGGSWTQVLTEDQLANHSHGGGYTGTAGQHNHTPITMGTESASHTHTLNNSPYGNWAFWASAQTTDGTDYGRFDLSPASAGARGYALAASGVSTSDQSPPGHNHAVTLTTEPYHYHIVYAVGQNEPFSIANPFLTLHFIIKL